MKYTPIIGLEVHVELKTKSKMFCSCPADYFGKEPNSHTCPVCLGLPGALPVPNKQALEWCKMIALALNCDISKFSKFDRKNYFYPDLSKGYQISQYDLPFGLGGYMDLSSGKRVGITRVHMEEDTAKLSHQLGISNDQFPISNKSTSIIDFNRSGVPLVEIVTEPDFNSAEEVKEYLQNLQQIVRYLDVSNADMEKGDMRLEPNISLIPTEKFVFPTPKELLPKYKVEVKNINSFKYVVDAIQFETKRHTEILDAGQIPPQETRGWNENKGISVSQRLKEEAMDYRYFPEPDIPPLLTTDAEIEKLKNNLPELPQAKLKRFITEYSLTPYDAEILIRDRTSADTFEEIVTLGKSKEISPKQIANAIINKKVTLTQTPKEIIEFISESSQVATVDEAELTKIIQEVMTEQPKAVTDFKSGKETVIMFLVGAAMKKLTVKPDVRIIKEKLEASLK